MLQRVLRKLEDRYPWLADWLGDRLDLQLPALSGSLIVHLLLLAFVGTLTYAVSTEHSNELRSEVLEHVRLQRLRNAGADGGGLD